MLTKYTNGAVLRSGPTLHHLRWTAGPVLEFSSGRTPQWMSTAAGYSWEVGERERWCYSSTRADSRLQRWEMFKPTTLRWHDAHPSTWLLLHARKKVLQCTDSCEREGLNRLFCVDNAVLFKYFPLQDGAVQAHGHEASRMCRVQTEKRKPSWPLRARQNVPKMCP